MKATVQYQHEGHHVVVNRAFIVGVLPELGYLMRTPSNIQMFLGCDSHLLQNINSDPMNAA
jgi:hypothetical protein